MSGVPAAEVPAHPTATSLARRNPPLGINFWIEARAGRIRTGTVVYTLQHKHALT